LSAHPELSVIVPIEDTRGQEEAAVRSLVSEQTLDRDRYEVIVPMPGANQDAERRVAGLLDPERDRAIPSEGLSRYALMNLGAEQARAERLFFIEAHCVAEAECLEEMLEFLAGNHFVGASCASHSKSDSPIGRYEDDLFGQSLEWLPQPDHWYKTLIHGFAVDREAFEAVGGFQHRFGNFSDIALSAAFDQGGYSLGYAPAAKVRHFYEGELRGTFDYIHDELWGEMAFRAAQPAAEATRYTPDAYEWKVRGTDLLTARRLRRDARRAARRRGTPLRLRLTLLRAAVSRNGRPALGGRLRAGLARLRLGARWAGMAARLRLRRPSYPAYLRWWEAATRYIRLHHLSGEGFPPRPWRAADGPLDLGSPEDGPLSGFGLVEEFEGAPLRWSGRAAAVELELDPGPHQVTLGVAPVRDPRDAPTTAVFDGHALADSAVRLHSDRVEIEIDSGSVDGARDSHSLSVFTVPGRSYRLRHRRALGLPVHTISVEPA
jgi:hypothetical protein